MKNWFSFPSVQIALITGVFGLICYWLIDSVLGRVMVLFVGWVYAAAITRPLMNLVANFRHGVRAVVWLPVHGMHYVFKGTTIHVLQDDDNWRWVPLADVEQVLGRKLNARTLAITYPQRLEMGGKPARTHMRDDALVEHLSKLSDPVALRFRTWVDRSVALPARRTRQRAAGQAVDAF